MSYLPLVIKHNGIVVGTVTKPFNVTGADTSVTRDADGNVTLNVNTSGFARTSGATFTGAVNFGANVTLQNGVTIDGRRPSTDGLVLDAINQGIGALFRTNSNTFSTRTLTGTARQITVTNGDGVNGNPVVSVPDNIKLPGTYGVTLPSGPHTTEQADLATIRFDTDENLLEIYGPSGWEHFLTDADKRFTHTHLVEVKPDPGKGQFASINEAIASVTDAAWDHRYVVAVYPGSFIEDPIIMKEYVYVIGSGRDATRINAKNPNDHLVYSSKFSRISNLTLTGATGEDKALVYHHAPDGVTINPFIIDDVRFGACNTFVLCDSGQVNINNTIMGAMHPFVRGFVARDDGIHQARIQIRNSTTSGMTAPYPVCMFMADGPRSQILGTGVLARTSAPAPEYASVGLHLRDGGSCRITAFSFVNFNKGIWVENAGDAPNMSAFAFNLESNYQDVVIEHPGTTGSFSGGAAREKSVIAEEATVTVFYADLEDQGIVNVGPLYTGPSHSKLVDVSPLIYRGMQMGIMEGGEISIGTGLHLDVTAGFGYARIDDHLHKVEWPATNVSVPANTLAYLYVDTDNQFYISPALPSATETIILGRFLTNATSVVMYGSQGSLNIENFNPNLDSFLRLGIGPLFVSGSIVTPNATYPLGVDVSAGFYFYGTEERHPVAVTHANLLLMHHNNGTVALQNITELSNSLYDNGTGLAAVPAGHYVKHVIYTNGDTTNVGFPVGYGNATFATLEEAEASPLPPPLVPPDGSPMIAAVIVQQGNPNIVEIIDLRPKFNGVVGQVTGAVSLHGDLLGLTNDDHPQYLLANGARKLSGDLNLNSNNLLNVGTINGMNFIAHATRHLPNGADALATAAPVKSIGTTSTNAVGIANSFARSDHSHALDNTVWTSSNHPTTISGYGITDAMSTSLLASTDHGVFAGLLDDDHTQYVHNTINRTITANHTFAPTTARVPFTLGANAQGQLVTGLNADKVDGLDASAFQPVNTKLTTLANMATTGLLVNTSTNPTVRTLTGTANQITVVNGDGIAGNPVISLVANPVIPGINGLIIPSGTTNDRVPNLASIRYNSTADVFEGYTGRGWVTFSGTGGIENTYGGSVPQQSGNTRIVAGSNPPAVTEGTQLFSQVVVPTRSNSRFLIDFSGMVDTGSNNAIITIAIFRGNTFIGASSVQIKTVGACQPFAIKVNDAPNTTSNVTYSARIGIDLAATWYLGRTATITYGGTNPSGWFISEVLS